VRRPCEHRLERLDAQGAVGRGVLDQRREQLRRLDQRLLGRLAVARVDVGKLPVHQERHAERVGDQDADEDAVALGQRESGRAHERRHSVIAAAVARVTPLLITASRASTFCSAVSASHARTASFESMVRDIFDSSATADLTVRIEEASSSDTLRYANGQRNPGLSSFARVHEWVDGVDVEADAGDQPFADRRVHELERRRGAALGHEHQVRGAVLRHQALQGDAHVARFGRFRQQPSCRANRRLSRIET
jgi:hypothetical protein